MLPGFLLLVALSGLRPLREPTVSSNEELNKAQALAASGRVDEAVPLLESYVSSNPTSLVGFHSLAAAYAAVGDDRAEQTYRRAIALSPRDYPLRLELTESLWALGRSDAGNEEIRKLLAEAGSPRLHEHYAFELLRQQRFADASREFERACSVPCEAEALEAWAGALLETGSFAESAARYRQAIAREPNRISARHSLGRVLLLAGDPASARVELERAVERAPRSGEVLFDLGRAIETLGHADEAEAAYRKSLVLAPELSRAHYALGTLLARRGRGEEARREIALYQRAFEREQKERFQAGARRAELSLGWTDLARGQAEQALSQFERLGDDAEALRGKAAALSRLGRHAEAVATLDRALSIAPADPRIRYALAREREKANRP